MKDLKYIVESLLDDEDELAINIEDVIRNFIASNYTIDGGINIRKRKGFYVVDGKSVWVRNKDIEQLTNGLFRWGKITNEFKCVKCEKLTSLEGAPEDCYDFECSQCDSLENLEGAPKKCEKFDCTNCENLTTLIGAPKKCRFFWCGYNNGLTSLKGAPEEVDVIDFSRCENLVSLDGFPKKVSTSVRMNRCDKLKDKELPHHVKCVVWH